MTLSKLYMTIQPSMPQEMQVVVRFLQVFSELNSQSIKWELISAQSMSLKVKIRYDKVCENSLYTVKQNVGIIISFLKW